MTLTTSDIAFKLQSDDNANWSYAGARALAEYLEEMEESMGEEMELDVVAIRCDFSEHESLQAWAKDYHGTEYLLEACEAMGIDEDIATGEDEDEIDAKIREYIQDHGQLIEFSGGVIVSSF